MFIVLLIFSLLFWAYDATAEPHPPSAVAQKESDPFVRAPQLIDQRQFDKAIELLERALRDTPDNPEIRFWLGVAYFKQGDDLKAERAFKAVTIVAPQHLQARYNLGAVYFRQNKWAQAIDAFLKTAEIDPRQRAHLYLNVGLSYYKQGSVQNAITWFQKVLTENPSPTTEQKAQTMLGLLTPAKGPVEKTKWTLRVTLGRQYDTNVFLTPVEEELISIQEDWATIGSVNLGYSAPVSNTVLFTPKYYFFGRWYDSENRVNYHLHEIRLGFEIPEYIIKPHIRYSYIYTLLGNNPFLGYHRFSSNTQLFRVQKHYFGIHGSWSLGQDLDSQYDYLSGTKWNIGISEVHYIFKNRGYVRSILAYSRINLKDVEDDPRFACEFCSYSYNVVEPSIQFLIPLIEKFKSKGFFQYQYRIYHDQDTWPIDSLTTGRKQREDKRFTFSASLLRPVSKHLEVEFKYWGQINRSNLGDDPEDYIDRDHRKNLYTLNLNLIL